MSEGRRKVLVVGGTGYLGQHLLQELGKPYDVAFTYHSATNPSASLLQALLPSPPRAFKLDLQTGEGLDLIADALGPPHVVVNCAAISAPRACEMDPAVAMATNIPSSLVKWLSSFGDFKPLLIHLSTDQVYEGVKSFYKEEDDAIPVNVYGKSKLAAELFISSNYSNYAILRSSIIYGQQSVSPVKKSLPIQWIDGVLSEGKDIEFFQDEFRCPVYVKDVVDVILRLIKKSIPNGEDMQLLLNVGGPDRVSRVQMAEAVAAIKGYDISLIKPVPAASVNRGVISPSDISMDISRLVEVLGISPVSFRDGVKLTLDVKDHV
ncbi:Methionine adenosyltransferase 2 subunit beta [Nymphaea thermarum]|nr:Methionine adenosyltransferase 2 subunit beta [Nymphaea thermarum]